MKSNEIGQNSQYNKLAEQQRRKIKSKENEIKKINNLYNEKVSALQVEGDNNLAKIREQNDIKLIEEINHNQEKMDAYNESYKKNIKYLESAKHELTKNHQAKMLDIENTYQEKFADIHDNNLRKSKDITQKAQNEIQQLHRNTDHEINQASISAKQRLNTSINRNEMVINNQEQEFSAQKHRNDILFSNLSMKQKALHEKSLKEQADNNQMLQEQQRIKHEKTLAKTKEHYTNLLMEKKEQFEKRYKALQVQHDQMMQSLQGKLNNELTNAIGSFANEKEFIDARSKNDFYKINTLLPKVQENPSDYIISIDVPEYEKESVIMNAQGRELKIQLTRRFEAEVEGQNGTKDKSARSEVFTKTFNVADIVDPSSITQKYEDGQIQFQIKKL